MPGKVLQALALIAISTTAVSTISLMTQQSAYGQSTTGCERSGNRPPGCNTRPVPEPLTIFGTLIGGTAAWSMRKKLINSAKR